MKEITKEELDAFEFIVAAGSTLALVKTEFDGIETAAICLMTKKEGDGDAIDINPIAIMVNDEIFARLLHPEDLAVQVATVPEIPKQKAAIGLEDLSGLKKAYNKAVKEGLTDFTYKNSPLLVSYAKYLIEFLEGQKPKTQSNNVKK